MDFDSYTIDKSFLKLNDSIRKYNRLAEYLEDSYCDLVMYGKVGICDCKLTNFEEDCECLNPATHVAKVELEYAKIECEGDLQQLNLKIFREHSVEDAFELVFKKKGSVYTVEYKQLVYFEYEYE